MQDSTTVLALVLVLASAAAHATWNLLLKKAQRQEVFAWWLSGFGVFGALPIAVVLALRTTFEIVGVWYIIATILLHICYFLFLGRSLARSDLSLVYPIARGFGPGLVPILAVFSLGETVTPGAWVGIGLVVVGIYTTAWWGQLRQFTTRATLFANLPGLGYALLTGLCISLYTIVDKRGVAHVSPFLYLYLMTAGVAVGWLPYIIRNYGVVGIVQEWRGAWRSVIVASALLFLAYGLVLTAMSITDVSFVAPVRGGRFAVRLVTGSNCPERVGDSRPHPGRGSDCCRRRFDYSVSVTFMVRKVYNATISRAPCPERESYGKPD